jgi:hypothetical protein
MKYWYLWYIGECPVCGSDHSYRERRYTPKPEKREDRIKYLSYTETYDHCMEY